MLLLMAENFCFFWNNILYWKQFLAAHHKKLSWRVSSDVEKVVMIVEMQTETQAEIANRLHISHGKNKIGSLILTPMIRAKLTNNPIK